MSTVPSELLRRDRLPEALPDLRGRRSSTEPRFAFRRHMIIHRDFEHLLKRAGLDNFDAIMAYGKESKDPSSHKERATTAITIPDGDQKVTLFLTRFRHTLVSRLVTHGLSPRQSCSAVKAWRLCLALVKRNLPTAIPIAAGFRRQPPLTRESFLVTLGRSSATTVRQMAEEAAGSPSDPRRRARKRAFLSALALLMRGMHDEGFRHANWYLSEILVSWSDPKTLVLALRDVHNVTALPRTGISGKKRDLALLNASAPQAFSRTDRLWFLKQYDPRLARNRTFMRALLRKSERDLRRIVANGKGDGAPPAGSMYLL